MNLFMRLFKEEEGQGLVEYALIIALIAVLLITNLQAVKGAIATAFESIVTALGSGT